MVKNCTRKRRRRSCDIAFPRGGRKHMGRKWYKVGGRRRRNKTNTCQKTSPPTNHSTRVSTAARTCPLERRGSVSKEQYRCMGAKFSVLPQRNETDAQMSERGTLAVYIERLVRIGCQLVARRHGGGGAPSARARGSAPVHFPRTGIVSTPLTQAPTEWAIF